MGRYLRLAILTVGLWICTAATMADNPAASTQSAPAAATATHAMASTTAEAASTASQPAAAEATVAAPAAATTAPASSTAPATASATIPVQASPGPSIPSRGMNMANVEHIFGAPQEKLPAIPDPGTKLHPPITRWVYPDYVVYFEYNYVVHTVLKQHPFADSGHSKS